MAKINKALIQADPFERRALEKTRVPPMNFTSDAQLKGGVWSRNNNLGIEQRFAPDANNRQTILKMPEWGFPQLWTISLGMKGFPQGTFNGFGIRGILEFGVGGSTQTMFVDWKVGTQITLVMNAINVIAEFYDLDVITEGQGLSLSVQVGRYGRSNNTPPTSILIVTEPGGPLPIGTIVQSIALGPGQQTGLMRLPPFTSRVYAGPAVLDSALTGNFFVDTVLLAIESGNGVGSLTIQSLRGSDLRLKNGIAVTGSGQFARLVNDSLNPIIVSVWAELSG